MGIRQLTWRWDRILNKAELKCQAFEALTPQTSAAEPRRAESLYYLGNYRETRHLDFDIEALFAFRRVALSNHMIDCYIESLEILAISHRRPNWGP